MIILMQQHTCTCCSYIVHEFHYAVVFYISLIHSQQLFLGWRYPPSLYSALCMKHCSWFLCMYMYIFCSAHLVLATIVPFLQYLTASVSGAEWDGDSAYRPRLSLSPSWFWLSDVCDQPYWSALITGRPSFDDIAVHSHRGTPAN